MTADLTARFCRVTHDSCGHSVYEKNSCTCDELPPVLRIGDVRPASDREATRDPGAVRAGKAFASLPVVQHHRVAPGRTHEPAHAGIAGGGMHRTLIVAVTAGLAWCDLLACHGLSLAVLRRLNPCAVGM